MPRDIPVYTHNFLYGIYSDKKSRASIWGCKRPEASPSNTHSDQASPQSNKALEKSANHRRSTLRVVHEGHIRPSKSSQNHVQTTRNESRPGQSEPRRANQTTLGLELPSSQHELSSELFTMHPFSRLSTIVKQCPWTLGSDIPPFAPGYNSDFYPPVPRSLKHDTAVSFVVTDHTRPEQPQFVISCPLEHVHLLREILAPTGSQRTLRARGSSGRPRDSGVLRSMLLDGTPNIELAIHDSPGASVMGAADAADDSQDRPLESRGSGMSRRHSFVRERPNEQLGPNKNTRGGAWPREGGVPLNFSAPLVPAMLVPHGWYPGGTCQGLRMEHASAPGVANP